MIAITAGRLWKMLKSGKATIRYAERLCTKVINFSKNDCKKLNINRFFNAYHQIIGNRRRLFSIKEFEEKLQENAAPVGNVI